VAPADPSRVRDGVGGAARAGGDQARAAAGVAGDIVAISLRRWWVELPVKELKGVDGMGQYQVTKKVDRVERSVAVAIMASLLLLSRHSRVV
jgi:hypothetical protein